MGVVKKGAWSYMCPGCLTPKLGNYVYEPLPQSTGDQTFFVTKLDK